MRAFRKLLLRARHAAGVGRFCRNEQGAAAVEFAMVMVPFLVFLMAIMQSALVLFAGQVLQTATTNAARQILTGQAQNAGWSAQQFQNSVCANLTVMFNCASNLYIDVRSFSNFSTVSLPNLTNPDGSLANNYVYQPGNPGDVVVVRMIYQSPIIAAAFGGLYKYGLSSATDTTNTHALIAAAAFRNEPYAAN